MVKGATGGSPRDKAGSGQAMPDVFLSYAREDLERVRPIVAGLEARGLSVWWDQHLSAGDSYQEVIEAELEAALAVVVAWSHTSVKSLAVRAEAAAALQRAALVPARIDDCAVPATFGITQFGNLIGWLGDPDATGWKEFTHSVVKKRDETAKKRAVPGAKPETMHSVEQLYWGQIAQSDDPRVFRQYLREYPKGVYAPLARRQIQVLASARPRSAQPSPWTLVAALVLGGLITTFAFARPAADCSQAEVEWQSIEPNASVRAIQIARRLTPTACEAVREDMLNRILELVSQGATIDSEPPP